MLAHIPTKVIRDALRWLDRVTVQAHPKFDRTRPDVTVLLNGQWVTRPRRAEARRPTTRATIGDACRYALYAWKHSWDEADLVQATAVLTRAIDQRRKKTRQTKQRVRDLERRNLAAAIGRRRRSGKDLDPEQVMAEAEAMARKLTRKTARPTPAYEAEIRARVQAARSLTQQSVSAVDWAARKKLRDVALLKLEALCLPAAPSIRRRPAIHVPTPGNATPAQLATLRDLVNGRRI